MKILLLWLLVLAAVNCDVCT
jgi:hypothetical protein